MNDAAMQSRWREYVRTRSPQLREALIRDYAILARRAVERLQITPWGCVNKDDLIGHAIIGLIDALDRFDPELGIPFEGYAMPRIRGAILDALRQLDWVPRSVRTEESRLRRVFAELEAALGRPPTDEEVAGKLGLSVDELDGLVAEISRNSLLSLEDLVAGLEDPVARDVGARDGSADPSHQQERGEARQRLVEALGTLPEREKLVVFLYYYQELTFKEIGKVLGVTEQRASQIHTKALLRLGHKLIRHTDLMSTLAA